MTFNIEPIKEAEQTDKPQIVVTEESPAIEPIDHLDICPYFDVSNPDNKTDDKLRFIFDYFKNKATSKADLLWRIRSIENKIGTPELGVKRYEKVYRYLKLLGDKRELEKEIEAHERQV